MNNEILKKDSSKFNFYEKKQISKNKHQVTIEAKQIIRELENLKKDLEQTRANFDLATDDSLIDSYIYEIISLNKKYQYFLNLAKSNGVIAEGFEKIG